MVVILYMLNGETIVGELVTPSQKNQVLLKHPCVIVTVQNPNQPEQVGVQLRGLSPFTAEKVISINADLVVYQAEALTELANQYNSLFGSGIVIAGPGSIPSGTPNLKRIK